MLDDNNLRMKQIIKRGSFLTLMFMLLGCLSLYAADNDLITKQITIKLEEAGTLPDRIGSSKKYKITNLKIIGEINGTDLRMIREMAGGKLSVLDLSKAKIVEGGDYYCIYYEYGGNRKFYTSNDVIGSYAFNDCSGLKEVRFCINDNIDTYLIKGHPYIDVDCGIKYYINDKEITSIEIPSNVTTLGNYVFQGCSRLTSLTLPAGITRIGKGAFWGCSGLTSLNLPAGITSIDYGTFWGCSGLTSLTLPAGITWIGSDTFKQCSGLASIYVYAEKVPKIGSNVFEGIDAKKCTLYVPMGTYDDYWVSDFGDYFENIVEFDATGIDKTTTSTDVEEVARYSVNGQRLSAPTKGLNIVKYSDGSVKKVAVR